MFQSAKLKLERANYHISDLEGQFKAFVLRKPHRFAIQNDSQTGQPIIQIRFVEPVPDIFSVIIGDAIHNTRCAIDHILWELIGIDGGTQNRHLMFSPRDDRANFEGWIKGIQTPSAWVKDFLRGWEAFPGGKGEAFHTLHDLDVADKHRAIRPVLRATGHPPYKIIGPNNVPIVTMSGNRFIGGGDVIRLGNIPPGCYVELESDADCPPDIFLPEITETNAIRAIRSLCASVSAALDESERAVKTNIAGAE